MDAIEWVDKELKIQREMLRIWTERHPREAAAVREEARAKVEKRKPDYGPTQIYGAGLHWPDALLD